MKYLPRALASLTGGTFNDFNLVVIDNASADESVAFVRQNYPRATIIRNAANLGASHARNQAIQLTESRFRSSGAPHDAAEKFILMMNPDVILTSDFLEEMIKSIKSHPRAAGICGELLRLTTEENDDLGEPRKTDFVDSLGLEIGRSRRVRRGGAGVFLDKAPTSLGADRQVFGAPGTLALYRFSALLEAARAAGEYFDEDFFAYQEDVDLSWRLRLLGWEFWLAPRARAYCYEQPFGGERRLWRTALAERRFLSSRARFLFIRNHLLLLAKNEQPLNFFLDAPYIVGRESKRLLGIIFSEPRMLAVYGSALRLLPRILGKRFKFFRSAHLPGRAMREWLVKPR